MANKIRSGIIIGALAMATSIMGVNELDRFIQRKNSPPTNLQPPTIYLPSQSVPFNQTQLYDSLRNKEGLTPPQTTPIPQQKEYQSIPNYRPPVFNQEKSIESESRLASI